ncbi:MAG: MBL fold metallo-hydrolase [Ktedonobacteraceae bacterium]|nr:MBL fold metallo-hydrolase [Ktedonobacteraceae bacterium]
MRVVSLGSGSSGNALLVEAGPQGRTKLLVDAGLSGSLIHERLRRLGVHPAQLQGILVTHEHSDHALSLPLLMKRYSIPIIADARTCKAIEDSLLMGSWRTDSGALLATPFDNGSATMPGDGLEVLGTQESREILLNAEAIGRMQHFPVGTCRSIGDIEVISFPISHDAVAPCGYLLTAGGCRVCIVTDSGEVTPEMLMHIEKADLLILEANHDRERLIRGPYPQMLKQRILSSSGHLSNDQAADAVLRTWRADSVRWLWLAHLSRTNNTPSLALKSVRARLQAAGANLAHIHISTLPPGMGSVWDSTQMWHAESLWEMSS